MNSGGKLANMALPAIESAEELNCLSMYKERACGYKKRFCVLKTEPFIKFARIKVFFLQLHDLHLACLHP